MVVGFVFDLDGVVYRHTAGLGSALIPGSKEALQRVREEGIPHVFVSNSTGHSEKEKADYLNSLLGFDIPAEQVILATSPIREIAPEYADKRVLVVALTDQNAHRLAGDLGLNNTVSVSEYARRHPDLHPVNNYGTKETQPLEKEEPIHAVFMLQEPPDWAEAIQIVSDIVRSDGIPGVSHERKTPDHLPLFVGNQDLMYGAAHSVPRYTNGAFLLCLQTLFKEATGKELKAQCFGKPHNAVYQYALKVLKSQVAGNGEEVDNVFFVGDNPFSDIAGANAAGPPFVSVLVRTGVFKGGPDDNHSIHPANYVVDNLAAAIEKFAPGERT
eukprot:m.4465 g.4465  ORF g.4465 m.4465 type:complete len:328 (+) comp5037_c0_seq1:2-985(+)